MPIEISYKQPPPLPPPQASLRQPCPPWLCASPHSGLAAGHLARRGTHPRRHLKQPQLAPETDTLWRSARVSHGWGHQSIGGVKLWLTTFFVPTLVQISWCLPEPASLGQQSNIDRVIQVSEQWDHLQMKMTVMVCVPAASNLHMPSWMDVNWNRTHETSDLLLLSFRVA